ncbi:hypothetical protein B0H63DRAFT_462818 [Podospora didyma]|uniref:Secreted protein n=1 Tax=Podospora didyma TaxID=330526 RepID=A0AAE0U8S8_9PEZI|nr:hypothetical protein B0H63DRAFT_462818 [Podospora didyma]
MGRRAPLLPAANHFVVLLAVQGFCTFRAFVSWTNHCFIQRALRDCPSLCARPPARAAPVWRRASGCRFALQMMNHNLWQTGQPDTVLQVHCLCLEI